MYRDPLAGPITVLVITAGAARNTQRGTVG